MRLIAILILLGLVAGGVQPMDAAELEVPAKQVEPVDFLQLRASDKAPFICDVAHYGVIIARADGTPCFCMRQPIGTTQWSRLNPLSDCWPVER